MGSSDIMTLIVVVKDVGPSNLISERVSWHPMYPFSVGACLLLGSSSNSESQVDIVSATRLWRILQVIM